MVLKFNGALQRIHLETGQLALKARKRGFSGKFPSIKEKEKLAKEFLKEKVV
ncbi:MAG: hypothetical protein HY392_00760 [Candidatus Diapherotrites archaeon]|nr:hypothetical protein [Candidatus Diapherotrites archaeon]